MYEQDYDYPDVRQTKTETRTAAKPHECAECGEEIAVGVRYRRAFYVEDGKPVSESRHEPGGCPRPPAPPAPDYEYLNDLQCSEDADGEWRKIEPSWLARCGVCSFTVQRKRDIDAHDEMQAHIASSGCYDDDGPYYRDYYRARAAQRRAAKASA